MNRIICYKKLGKLLIARGLNKVELQRLTDVFSAMITKLAKNETVNTRVKIDIKKLNAQIEEIVAREGKLRKAVEKQSRSWAQYRLLIQINDPESASITNRKQQYE